jgi:hypothetical protein
MCVVAVFFEYLQRRKVNTHGEKTIWVKCGGKEKERATAMLLGDWHGRKYAPFLLFKSSTSRRDHVQATNDAVRHGFGFAVVERVVRSASVARVPYLQKCNGLMELLYLLRVPPLPFWIP